MALILIAHIATAAFLWSAFLKRTRGKEKKEKADAVYCYAILIFTFFPVLGIFAGAFVIFFVKGYGGKFRQGLYDAYEEYLDTGKVRIMGMEVFSSLMRKVRNEVSFESYVDAMRGTDTAIKGKVIDKLSRFSTKDSVKLLKQALLDDSPEVRFYAAGALLKIEGELNKKITYVSKKVKQRGTARDFAFLGDLYRAYVDIGLVEKDLENYYLSASSGAYRKSLDMDTNQPDVIKNYSLSLVSLGQYEKAKTLLDSAIRIWPRDNEILFLRSRVYYELGRLDEALAALNTMDIDKVSEEKKEVLELWKSAG